MFVQVFSNFQHMGLRTEEHGSSGFTGLAAIDVDGGGDQQGSMDSDCFRRGKIGHMKVHTKNFRRVSKALFKTTV